MWRVCIGPTASFPNSFIISGCVLASFGLLSFLLFSPLFHGKQQHMQTHMALLICSPLNEREMEGGNKENESPQPHVWDNTHLKLHSSLWIYLSLSPIFPYPAVTKSSRAEKALGYVRYQNHTKTRICVSCGATPHKWKANWCQTRGAF